MSSSKVICLLALVFVSKKVHGQGILDSIDAGADVQFAAIDSVLWMFIPDDEGFPHLALFPRKWPKYSGDITQDVKLYLYTRSNRDTPNRLYVSNVDSLNKSGFNSSFPTKILIHGYSSDAESMTVIGCKEAYLDKQDYNIIGVDWSTLSSAPNYPAACLNARLVGEYLGDLIDFLVVQGGAKLKDFHIIGHSLGGQAAGFAGAAVRSGKVARITGLDSAYPMFGNADSTERLDPSDAVLVDAIHTCGGSLGFREAYAHVDFFPNGGTRPQPGCVNDAVGNCSHGKSVTYFIQTIKNPNAFLATECLTLEEAEAGQCTGQSQALMGDPITFGNNGMYYVDTTK